MNKLSGAERMVFLLCSNLKNYHAIVICGGEELKDYFQSAGIEAYSADFTIKGTITTFHLIKKLVIKNDAGIIHCHDNSASLIGYLVKNIYGLPVKIISHIHSCYPFMERKGIKKATDSIFRKRYDLNIFCGRGVLEFYKDNSTNFNRLKYTVISNAVELTTKDRITDSDIKKACKGLGIDENDFIVGFVGRLCSIKGILPLMEEIYKHKERFQNMKFLIVGSGDQEARIKAFIKENKLDNLFILTGFQKDVMIFYRLMDIFILPSRYEGLPMVLLEAMSEKVPVISMNVGGIEEILESQRGILVNKGDYKEFANSIYKLYGDEEERKSMGQRGYEYIKDNYGIKKYAATIERKYGEIDIRDGT